MLSLARSVFSVGQKCFVKGGIIPQVGVRMITSSSVCKSDKFFDDCNTEENNPDVSFEFTAKYLERAESIISSYPEGLKTAAFMDLLEIAQEQHGWLTMSAMHYVADMLKMPYMSAYKIATFFFIMSRERTGKYHVQVCTTTPCQLRGAEDIVQRCMKNLGIAVGGGMTQDGLFTLCVVECLGACVNAPMMQINDNYYEDLSLDDVDEILNDLKEGRVPKNGPRSGRLACKPAGGFTFLTEPPPGTGF